MVASPLRGQAAVLALPLAGAAQAGTPYPHLISDVSGKALVPAGESRGLGVGIVQRDPAHLGAQHWPRHHGLSARHPTGPRATASSAVARRAGWWRTSPPAAEVSRSASTMRTPSRSTSSRSICTGSASSAR